MQENEEIRFTYKCQPKTGPFCIDSYTGKLRQEMVFNILKCMYSWIKTLIR